MENLINDLHNSGDVILCGDFNSRIATLPGLIEHEHAHLNDYIPLPDDYVPDNYTVRCSEDIHTNTYGTDFLSIIINNRLTILNGRTVGDYTGAFTCIHFNGCSVVDYFSISSPLLPLIDYMKVLEFTQFSDHKPLSLQISTSRLNLSTIKPLESTYQPAPTRFVFDKEKREMFLDTQQDDNFTRELNELDKCFDNYNTDHITSVTDLNNRYTKYLHDMATICFKTTNNNTKRRNNNNPWFNRQCRLGKRELNKASRVTSKFPSSNYLRQNYYKVKKSYKSLLKNWKQLKKLKSLKSDKTKFDSLDMKNFENFFTNLYTDEHKTIDTDTKTKYINIADEINNTSSSPLTLNDEISIDEVRRSISSLKSGKAASLDMIINEIIKSLDSRNVAILTKLYNTCLDTGTYPWNSSVITPLHKKGSKDNPDNYRAVAVSSVIGKLFSTILLERLIEFRKANCPDPPNQLGFTKKAQTYDHILSIQTITSKYKKVGKKVYAVFVDFKKAFDTVCRQALFYKLAQCGITGKFYNVLRDMYSNSSAYIKLSGYLSKKFQINKGTEQGHPLSPDLFKIFLNDLSSLLEFKNCPILSDMLISHLLWADDLILLALDQKTIQLQLDTLTKFCNDWGIEINQQKTKVVIFGSDTDKDPSPCPTLYLNNHRLEVVDSYCYLGIVLHKSGKLSLAKENLKCKAMRALFSLKHTVNRSKLSFRALSTLFDSLIKPIMLYGAPLWTPSSSIIKNLSAAILTEPQNLRNIIPKINRTLSEKVHLSFLKWALGVHRKASNVGAWGETGRYPLIYQSIKLTLNYYQRLCNLNPGSIVYAALQEQKSMGLQWYKNIESLMKIDEIYEQDHVTAFNSQYTVSNQNNHEHSTNNTSSVNVSQTRARPSSSQTLIDELSKTNRLARPLPSKKFRPNQIFIKLRDHFKCCWEYEKSKSSKLSYYHSIKHIFNKEPYLDVISNPSHRYRTTRLRISAHDLEIEAGRYSKTPREKRTCGWCLLTFNLESVENEPHVIYHCDLYADLRNKLINTLKQAPSKCKINSCHIAFFHNLSIHNLSQSFTTLLSPNTNSDNTDLCFHNYNPTISDHQHHESNVELRSYIINAIGAFIGICFDRRWKFKSESRIASMT